jgi:4'-phosphopantetheinyl transferase
MNVYWLEQSETDVPAHDDWLGSSETIRLGTMRFAKRRADWRLGRWTAKCAVAAHLHLALDPGTLARLEILAGESGAPEIFVDGHTSDVTISLSHRAGRALCAVSSLPRALGCDLELVEPRSSAFVADYFSTEEQAMVAQACAPDRAALIALVWTAKESALKALRTGLRMDTRSVIVRLAAAAPGEEGRLSGDYPTPAFRQPFEHQKWHALSVRAENDESFQGYWQRAGDFLRTVVAAPPLLPPERIECKISILSCRNQMV